MDYDDIYNETWDELPVEKTLPDGGYRLAGANAAWVKPRDENGKAKVLFSYTAKEPLTVDPEVLEEALGDNYDLSMNNLTLTFFIEGPKDWQAVKKHLTIHGIEVTGPLFDENKKLSFAKAFRSSEVVAQVGHRFYQNNSGENVEQNTLSKFQPVSE